MLQSVSPSMPSMPIVWLMGPTGMGKTAAAFDVSTKYPITVISIDSVQVYRKLDCGTSKPSLEVLQQCPHRLIDVIEPWESFDVAQCCALVDQAVAEVRSEGRCPVFVGGTMMYFHALAKGLSAVPSASSEVRARVLVEAEEVGWAGMHERLREVDPAAYERLAPGDRQRIGRAWEVWYGTGRPWSQWLESNEQARPGAEPPPHHVLVMQPASMDERANLYQRLNDRFAAMCHDGLVDEVATLLEDPRCQPDAVGLRSVGYRQVVDYVQGRLNHASMVADAQQATRQLAKRQITWCKRWSHGRQVHSVGKATTALLEILGNLS